MNIATNTSRLITCRRCDVEKPETDFEFDVPGRRRKTCRLCRRPQRRAVQKAFQKRQSIDWRRRKRSRGRKNRTQRAKELIREKKQNPCMDCRASYPPIVMEFDHRPGTKKLFNVGQYGGKSFAVILAEIAKCDLVCANCHRLRTLSRMMERKNA